MQHTWLAILLALFLSACVELAPQSAAGLYAPKPVAQQIRGSRAQALESRLLDFTGDEVYAAASAAISSLDYQIDEINKKQGFIAASRHYPCAGSYRLALTLALYVTAVDTFPTTKITIQMDLQDIECVQNTALQQVQLLLLEIEQSLSES